MSFDVVHVSTDMHSCALLSGVGVGLPRCELHALDQIGADKLRCHCSELHSKQYCARRTGLAACGPAVEFTREEFNVPAKADDFRGHRQETLTAFKSNVAPSIDTLSVSCFLLCRVH